MLKYALMTAVSAFEASLVHPDVDEAEIIAALEADLAKPSIVELLGAVGLLETAEIEQTSEPVNDHARLLLQRVFGGEIFADEVEFSQSDAMLILENLVIPAYRFVRLTNFSDEKTILQIALRSDELRWFAEGKSAKEIMNLSGAYGDTVSVASGRKTVLKTLHRKIKPEQLQKMLFDAVEAHEWPTFDDPTLIESEQNLRAVTVRSREIKVKKYDIDEQIAAEKHDGTWRRASTGNIELDVDNLMVDYPIPKFAVLNDEADYREYLNSISRSAALLTREEEAELSERIEMGLFAGDLLLMRTKKGAEELHQKLYDNYFGMVRTDNKPKKVAEKILEQVSLDAAAQMEIFLGAYERNKDIPKKVLQKMVRDGERAKEFFIASNLKLVVAFANKFAKSGHPQHDLVQAGNMGMMHALELFDYKRMNQNGTTNKFSTYAVPWIKQAVGYELTKNGTATKVKTDDGEAIKTLYKREGELSEELGREPTDEECADRMQVPVERIRELKDMRRDAASLNKRVGKNGVTDESEASEFGDLIPDSRSEQAYDAVIDDSPEKKLELLVESLLTPEEARVFLRLVRLDDREPFTIQQVRLEMKISDSRVKHLRAMAEEKLRFALEAAGVTTSLDLAELLAS